MEGLHRTDKVQIHFDTIENDLFPFNLKIGEQLFSTRFSDVYNPIPDLKHWLEAIAIGAQQTSFIYDTEGQEIKMDFNNEDKAKAVFWVYDNLVNPEKFYYLKAIVYRKQLVEVFYNGLIEFVTAGGFNNTAWEELYDTSFTYFRSNIIEKFIHKE